MDKSQQEILLANLKTIHQRIKRSCEKSNRNPQEVRLLLATKTVDTNRINFALENGENLIGENKVQELTQKCSDLEKNHPEVHFIGHLQSNKIKEVLKWVSCIQSIDRFSLAEKLQNRLAFENKEIDVFIQVNTSYEESKFGVCPEGVIELVRKVSTLDRIHIKGLMTIGLFDSDLDKVRRCFRLLKRIQTEIDELNIENVEMKELSMGMSGDLEVAIEEGATIIRVGTAIFGKRIYPDSYYWNESSNKSI
ncbi:MAG: YggS family pyridoxal phosphate-dependent enzyme [Brumimicrobium sp.]